MATLLVPHEPTSAAVVRRALLADLSGSPIGPDTLDEVLVVASELVGNAVRHAEPNATRTLAVSWQVEPHGVTVRVSDSNGSLPRWRNAGPDETGGRGLTIVDALADAWGYDRDERGKHVWARVPVRTPSRLTRAGG